MGAASITEPRFTPEKVDYLEQLCYHYQMVLVGAAAHADLVGIR
jgi:hypothetical protein